MFKIPFFIEGIKNFFKKPLTSKYPKESINVPNNYRGKINFDTEKCIGCGLCTRVCAPGAIRKDTVKMDDGQEITLTFDLGSCTFCGLCSDYCVKKAITLSNEWEMHFTKEKDRIIRGSFIKKMPVKKN